MPDHSTECLAEIDIYKYCTILYTKKGLLKFGGFAASYSGTKTTVLFPIEISLSNSSFPNTLECDIHVHQDNI